MSLRTAHSGDCTPDLCRASKAELFRLSSSDFLKKEESGTVLFKLSLSAGSLEAKMIKKKDTTQTTLYIVCIYSTTTAGTNLRFISPLSSTEYELKKMFCLYLFVH